MHLELFLLDGSRRPVHELHTVLVDIICMMARNEFPLPILPRWLSELFEMLGRVVSLQMEANKWSLAPSPSLDLESQAYLAAASKNFEHDKRRFRLQCFKFSALEEEEFVGDSGHHPPCPVEDAVISSVPVGLGRYKPCMWLPPPRIGAPKRGGGKTRTRGSRNGRPGSQTASLRGGI